MGKFLLAWTSYAKQIEQMNTQSPYHIKKSFANKEFEETYKDKFSQEQTDAMKEFKDMIYESEQKRKQNDKS